MMGYSGGYHQAVLGGLAVYLELFHSLTDIFEH